MKFTGTKFMTADDKARVAKHWDDFLASNMNRKKFGAKLYQHISTNCDHIAHYDRDGFYDEWFKQPSKRIEFMQRWASNYRSGRFSWGAGSDYDDLHAVMYESLVKHSESIAISAIEAEKARLEKDIAIKEALLDQLNQ